MRGVIEQRQPAAQLPQALTLDDAVAGAVQVLAVGQVCTTWHDQAGAMLRPAAAQQLGSRQGVNLCGVAGW
jgi:hypothetical protein